VSIRAVEVYEVRCDAYSPRCMMSGAYESETQGVALRRAKADGWRAYGNQVFGFRHKCPECVIARAKLEALR
jgi:hypothetical protein